MTLTKGCIHYILYTLYYTFNGYLKVESTLSYNDMSIATASQLRTKRMRALAEKQAGEVNDNTLNRPEVEQNIVHIHIYNHTHTFIYIILYNILYIYTWIYNDIYIYAYLWK